MKSRFDRSLAAAAAAGACIVVFSLILFAVARSFRSSIAEMAESGTRVTIVNADGSVFYDTDDATDNHATREEVRQAFARGHSTVLREREAKKLERERKKMLTQIKKLAEKGQTTGAKMMAKDIVRAKNQQQKLEQFVGQLNAVSLRIGSCASLNELGDAMANCAKAMTLVSSKLDAKKLAHMAKEIAKQDMQLDMKSDMMSEILDSLDEGNEEEEEAIYNQVLQEAGVHLAEQLNVDGEQQKQVNNNAINNKVNEQPSVEGTDDLDALLKDLNSK